MKISIVTVHLDELDGLLLTRESLLELLGTPDIEWLVIDGGSMTAGGKAANNLDLVVNCATTFLSEQDRGIYDAMNKGTGIAKGDYVLYLNAGDALHPEFSLAKLESSLNGRLPEMIWGTCYERFPDGSLVKLKNRSPGLAWYGVPVNHQNVLFRRDILGDSPYDLRYTYCADYDLISRLLGQRAQVHRTSLPIAIFERGGIGSLNFSENMKEEELLRTQHFGVNKYASRGISYLKRVNRQLGSVPAIRRMLRKWV